VRIALEIAKRWSRCQANLEQIRKSRPDSGLGFLPKVTKTFQVVPASLGSDLRY